MEFKLHGYWRSGCSWRVRIALSLKMIEYLYVPVDLSQLVGNVTEELPADYRAKNNMAQLPTLEISGMSGAPSDPLVLTQSLPIVEFLDETHPEVSLLGPPGDAVTRFKVREIAEIINSGTQPLQNLGVLRMVKNFEMLPLPPHLAEEGSKLDGSTGGKGFAKFHILKGLAAVESKLEEYGSEKYCVGEAVTLADICLVPQMYNARRFMLDVEKYFPRCVAVDAHLATLDAFQKAHPDAMSDAKK